MDSAGLVQENKSLGEVFGEGQSKEPGQVTLPEPVTWLHVVAVIPALLVSVGCGTPGMV